MQIFEDAIIHKVKEQEQAVIEFNTGNALLIDKVQNEIKLLGKNKNVQMVISINAEGLVLNIDALKLNINALEELTLKSKKINIEGTNHINIKSNGNFVQEVGKDALTEVGGTNKLLAQIHKITANLGNVDIKANDDVRLDGERIKLNCD